MGGKYDKRHFHVPQFFYLTGKVEVFIPLFIFFYLYSVARRVSKGHSFTSSLLFVDYYKVWSSNQDKVIRLYVKIPEEFVCVSFSRTDAGLCIYHLFKWSNLDFLQNSQWITLPTQSCLVLYSFCTSLLCD